jgi:hypothetical protein
MIDKNENLSTGKTMIISELRIRFKQGIDKIFKPI